MIALKTAPALAAALLVVACSQPEANKQAEAPPMAPEAAANPSASLVTDTWIGRWTGPEGLFLDIKPGGALGVYALTLKDNLDSQTDYPAQAAGDAMTFARAGKTVTIRAGTGAETGMKWLADKRDCLILVPNVEGYCRD